MLITATSKDDLILSNIVDTLSQIKESGKPNQKLALDYAIGPCSGLDFEGMTLQQFGSLTVEEFAGLVSDSGGDSGPTCTVSFYTDEDRTTLLFAENSTSNSASFSVVAGRTLYTPPDGKLNDAAGLSTTKAQPLYWVTVEFCDGTTKKLTYRNCDNLCFPTVRVASKGEPKFSGAGSSCTIVPQGQRIEERKVSESPDYVILKYELTIQLPVYNWSDLSEQERVSAGYKANNLLRNALYADRSRGSHCTFFNERINGTFVGEIKLLPSKDMLKGTVFVECCFVSASTGY